MFVLTEQKMHLKTPVQEFRTEKKTHTPPSEGRHSSLSPSKFFKSLSGKGLRRVGSKLKPLRKALRETSGASPVVSKCADFSDDRAAVETNSCENLLVPKPLPKAFKRQKVPAPLDLQALTPPTTLRKFEEALTQQDSPTKFRAARLCASPFGSQLGARKYLPSSPSNGSKRDLSRDLFREAFLHNARSPVRRASGSSLLSDTEIEPCPGKNSPTRLSATKRCAPKDTVLKRFTHNTCSMCDEKLSTALSGERVVELTCGHQCHHNCYLAVLETTLPENQFPACDTCHKVTKPRMDSVLNSMTSSLLTNREPKLHQRFDRMSVSVDGGAVAATATATEDREKNLGNVSQHIVLGSSGSGAPPSCYGPSFTPQDQIISSSDVCCDGFTAFRAGPNTSAETAAAVTPGTLVHEPSTADSADMSMAEFMAPRISIVPQCTTVVVCEKFDSPGDADTLVLPYVLNIYMPELEDGSTRCSQENCDDSIKSKIAAHLVSQLCIDEPADDLQMFDRMEYSLDGDNWESITACLFCRCIAFSRGPILVGKLPLAQLSTLCRLAPDKIVLNLRSTSLPELYLRCLSNPILMSKWVFYLDIAQTSRARKAHGGWGPPVDKALSESSSSAWGPTVPLIQLTTNSWGTVPQELLEAVPKDIVSFNSLAEKGLDLPLSRLHRLVPQSEASRLDLVVCVSIVNCCPQVRSNQELQRLLQAKLRGFRDSLREQDALGLVILGRDGSGKAGPEGTFVGMVSKAWSGWDGVIDSLSVVDNGRSMFPNEAQELTQMLRTSVRLFCTLDKTNAQSHLVLLGNDRGEEEGAAEAVTVATDAVSDLVELGKLTNQILCSYGFSVYHCRGTNNHVNMCELLEGFKYNVMVRDFGSVAAIDAPTMVAELQGKTLCRLKVDLESTDASVAAVHAVEKNGKLVCSGTDAEVTLWVGDLAPGDTKNIMFDMCVQAGELRRRGAFGRDAGADAQVEGSATESSVSIVNYRASWGQGEGKVKQGKASDVKVVLAGPASMPATTTASVLSQFEMLQDMQKHKDNSLDGVSAVPQLCVPSDPVFAKRQIELSVVRVLGQLFGLDARVVAERIEALVSSIRTCRGSCTNVSLEHQEEAAENSVAKESVDVLCEELQEIASLCTANGSSSCDPWQMRALINKLICQ